jgi:hypothetical protein
MHGPLNVKCCIGLAETSSACGNKLVCIWPRITVVVFAIIRNVNKELGHLKLKTLSAAERKALLPSTCHMRKKAFHKVLVIIAVAADKIIESSLSYDMSSFLK